MASASSVSSDKTNFTRLARLLISGGTSIFRELFDSMYPPASLATVLKTPIVEQRLESMKSRRLLTLPQWNILYPSSSSCGKSESFDITLLFKLIRELGILIAPVTGWDELPYNQDLSLPADLARIKFYRNTVYAHESMEITDGEFSNHWKQIEGALIRIVAPSAVTTWRKAIDKLRAAPITEEDQRNIEELESWYYDLHYHQQDKQMLLCSIEEIEILGDIYMKEIIFPEVTLRCVLKLATVGAWVAGSAYIIVRYKDDPEELINMIKEAVLPTGMVVSTITIVAGSIKIRLQRAEDLDALDCLLIRCKSGQLAKDLETVFVTEELKELAKGEVINFSVEINKREYRTAYRERLSVSQNIRKDIKTILQNIDKKVNPLRKSFNKWIDQRHEVIIFLTNLLEKEQRVRLNTVKAKRFFFALTMWFICLNADLAIGSVSSRVASAVVTGVGAAFFTIYGIATIVANSVYGVPRTAIAAAVAVAVAVAVASAVEAVAQLVLNPQTVLLVVGLTAVGIGITAVVVAATAYFAHFVLCATAYFLKACRNWYLQFKTKVFRGGATGENRHRSSPIDFARYNRALKKKPTTNLRDECDQITDDIADLLYDTYWDVYEDPHVKYVIHRDQEVINEVNISIRELKYQVKRLKKIRTRILSSKTIESSEFEKPFQIEEFIESFALPCTLVESLMAIHKGDKPEADIQIRDMINKLKTTCPEEEEMHDMVEEYLDELFTSLADDTN